MNKRRKIAFSTWLAMLMLLLFVSSCETDDSLSSADRNVVSDDGTITFEELILLVNIKNTDGTYLVVESVDSVRIYINDYYWAIINSQAVDISKVDKRLDGNKYVTDKKLNYLIIADQDVEEPAYNTAGEFAQYLNDGYSLKPGEYACFIESFQLRFSDNSVKTYYPFEYSSFKVEENSKSAFVGELTLNID